MDPAASAPPPKTFGFGTGRRAFVEEQLRDRFVAVLGRDEQRRRAVLPRPVDVGACAEANRRAAGPTEALLQVHAWDSAMWMAPEACTTWTAPLTCVQD